MLIGVMECDIPLQQVLLIVRGDRSSRVSHHVFPAFSGLEGLKLPKYGLVAAAGV